MAVDFYAAVKSISDSTGLKVRVFLSSGSLEYGTADFAFEFLSAVKAARLTTVLCDKEQNVTFFPFKNGNSGYIGVIEGSSEAEKNYAKMLRFILGGVPSSSSVPVLTKEEKFRLYFKGELSDTLTAALKAEYFSKAFDYYVLSFVTDSASKLKELKGFLQAISDGDDVVVPLDEKSLAFIKKCGTIDEYQSANDFAYTLYDNIKDELRINFVINVGGTTHSFDDLLMFFNQCAFAYSFGRLMSPNENIYSYKEYIMIKMLADIPKSTLTQYLGTLLDTSCLDIITDDELMSTAEEFLKNSLNISETSRSIYMHRNTLIYRLDKIENATGLNIRHFNDAVIFRLITILNKLTSSKL